LRDHVGCADSVQAVDVDVPQTALKADDVGLAVLRSIEVRAGFWNVSAGSFLAHYTSLTCIVIVEEGIMAGAVNEHVL
jgi:hypothetical protein